MPIKLIALLLVACTQLIYSPSSAKKIRKIVIDAGHGGKDNGAQGSYSKEKDLTLAVALKLGRLITDSLPGVQVIYTRTTDDYPSLPDRHELANQMGADLFISVHVNSTPYTYSHPFEGYRTVRHGHHHVKKAIYGSVRHHETQRQGVETYVLGLHRNPQKEGAIGEYGDNVTNDPGLLNVNDPQTEIIVSQYAQAFLDRSVDLATKIQEQFALEGRPDLGVKQKGLEVLAGSAMPGVLVEIGFIDNPEEEEYLNSEPGQWAAAKAIYRGIAAYKEEVEK